MKDFFSVYYIELACIEVTCSPFNLAPVVKLPVAGGGVDPILFGAGCEISSSSRIAAAVCNFGKRTFSHFLRS